MAMCKCWDCVWCVDGEYCVITYQHKDDVIEVKSKIKDPDEEHECEDFERYEDETGDIDN